MIEVRPRNEQLTRPIDIYEDKLQIIYEWILEFRFSDKKTLARRLRQPVASCERVLRRLKKEEWLLEFGTDYAVSSAKFLMFGPKIRAWMIARGIEPDHRIVTTPTKIQKSSQIIHHLMTQNALLQEIEEGGIAKIVSEFNMQEKSRDKRPDALMLDVKGDVTAIEVERWQKDKARTYYSFFSHIKKIKDKSHQKVIYYTGSKQDHDYYKRSFDSDLWTEYRKKKGRYYKNEVIKVPESSWVRNGAFSFKVLKKHD